MAKYGIEAVFEDDKAREFLKTVGLRLKNVRHANKAFVGLISTIVFKDVMNHFDKEEGPKGPWEAWSDSYQKQLNSMGRGGNKILQFTGRLRQNFKPTNVRGTPTGILWYNDAVTKSGFPYAAAHDEGGGKLPSRPFMWLSDDALKDIASQTLNYLVDEGAV